MKETSRSKDFLDVKGFVVGVVDFDGRAVCDIGRDFGSYKRMHFVGVLDALSIDVVDHLTHIGLDNQIVLHDTHSAG